MESSLKIILSGGGTMGSVVPLLAVREKMIEQGLSAEFLWVGTEAGVEKELISKEMSFVSIKSGKLRRYLSFQNFLDPFRLLIGIFQSLAIIRNFRPNLILSAGGYVSVPLIIAGKLSRIKSLVHQQDLQVGLANRIMAKFATIITVSFESLLKSFDPDKVRLVGNPVRSRIYTGDKTRGLAEFNLVPDLSTLVVMGGSLGAEKINELMFQSIPQLIEFCQIIHVVGKGNMVEWMDKEKFGELANRYHPYEYVDQEMPDLYAVADLVVCRAGLSTLSELAALKKPTIIIPIPKNQQEINAEYFAKQNAIILLSQDSLTAEEFVETVRGLFSSSSSLGNLSRHIADSMIPDAAGKFVELIKQVIK
ncbi:MAG: undecaprenyldiphospho-muramoylpentapeptide beta-N-acetylglucosaminyltransferase [Parcubacteria group bacterium GW2011_GWC2_39_14]|nr:MAG: undecaprenyldiphospho-muramoylpentapeptide beta-N-acetylglucosaminyltransferase [Parcubacteria group bacterium GW2011_GWC2_39_14]KKR55184.1 MAG: undecaprenyldiphospho-muramoylpentapeptide beta-N-acetylglucosaminyltransferase [Parcubacteria group bacterium GW2011_GWA2_40_23]